MPRPRVTGTFHLAHSNFTATLPGETVVSGAASIHVRLVQANLPLEADRIYANLRGATGTLPSFVVRLKKCPPRRMAMLAYPLLSIATVWSQAPNGNWCLETFVQNAPPNDVKALQKLITEAVTTVLAASYACNPQHIQLQIGGSFNEFKEDE